MTRKDYVRLASALAGNKVRPIAGWENVHAQWCGDVLAIADALAADNPRFDRDRFYAACRLTAEDA